MKDNKHSPINYIFNALLQRFTKSIIHDSLNKLASNFTVEMGFTKLLETINFVDVIFQQYQQVASYRHLPPTLANFNTQQMNMYYRRLLAASALFCLISNLNAKSG